MCSVAEFPLSSQAIFQYLAQSLLSRSLTSLHTQKCPTSLDFHDTEYTTLTIILVYESLSQDFSVMKDRDGGPLFLLTYLIHIWYHFDFDYNIFSLRLERWLDS